MTAAQAATVVLCLQIIEPCVAACAVLLLIHVMRHWGDK